MTINWGGKIIITFILFFIVMGNLVYRSATEDHQLVAPDYYQQEVAFQDVIDQKQKAKELGVSWKEHNGTLCLLNPTADLLEGKVMLYRASNKDWDRVFTYAKDKNCLLETDFQTGKWKVSFHGKLASETVYTEHIWIIL